MKTETILLLGIAAAAGWYFFIRKPEPAAAPAAPPQTIINQAKRTNWQDVAISGINAAGNIANKIVPGT